MFVSNAYAQTVSGGTSSTLMGLLPLLIMFVLLYFLMLRPQIKRQKEHKAMLEALAKNDEVVTSGGLLGRVVSFDDSHVELLIAAGTTVQVQRHAITQVLPQGTVTAKAATH